MAEITEGEFPNTDEVPVTNSGNINILASDLLLKTVTTEVPRYDRNNREWAKRCFLVDESTLDNNNGDFITSDVLNKRYSSASFKYTDSSLGGNFAINTPTQFTRYADIRDKGFRFSSQDTTLEPASGDIGMGRYYSEAIDDNNQIIHFRFGVPQYNSLTQFFTGFYSSSASTIARTGRLDDTFINKFLQFGSNIISLAVLPLVILPIAFMLIGQAARFFLNFPSSKFYYLKPTMPAYWNAVQTMVNQIAVNKGVVHYPYINPTAAAAQESVIGRVDRTSDTERNIFTTLTGTQEFSSNGVINVYAVANKSKRLETRNRLLLNERFEKGSPSETWFGKVRDTISQGSGVDTPSAKESPTLNLEEYLTRWLSAKDISIPKVGKEAVIEADIRQGVINNTLTPEETAGAAYKPRNIPESVLDFFISELADGSAWASFRVDYTGSVSESFSSSHGQSSLAQKINSTSSSARNIYINTAGGNIDSFGISSAVLSGVTSVIKNVADTLSIGGLAAFAGSAFVDIPDHWESSAASLPKSNYTLTLISPYGNPVSQMFSIYVPLCMLLAGALPIATGKQSYTSPFMCSLFDRGRSITRLGMIDSIQIQRGTSNLGFNSEGQAMAIEVSFSVKDMSNIIAMPIQEGFLNSIVGGLFDTENSFSDYLAALAGLSLRDVTDRLPILKYQLNNVRANVDTFLSTAHFAQYAASLPGVNLLGAAMRGTDRK